MKSNNFVLTFSQSFFQKCIINCISQLKIMKNEYSFSHQIYSIKTYIIIFILREFKDMNFFFLKNLFIMIITC